MRMELFVRAVVSSVVRRTTRRLPTDTSKDEASRAYRASTSSAVEPAGRALRTSVMVLFDLERALLGPR
jgi:hypothetical protein